MEKEIINLHSTGMNSKDISIKLNIKPKIVYETLKKYNLKSNNNKPLKSRLFNEDEVELMINLYNEGLTCKEIYDEYFKDRCRGHSTIQGLLSRRIKLRKVGKRIDFNERFFETINTERKAYWLGLFMQMVM